MAKQAGRKVLIKMEDPGTPDSFVTLCGLTSKTFRINNTESDVTSSDCTDPAGPIWTEVLTGVKRMSLSGNGLLEGADAEDWLNALALADESIANFQAIVPGLGTFESAFFLSDVEYGGEDQSGGATYSLSLASSGVVTFTAEA